MKARILIDGRPAQGRPRGMGIYVLRLLPALAVLSQDLELRVALDLRSGGDPWPDLKGVERIWGQGGNPFRWEQKELPQLAERCGAQLLHCTANTSPWKSPVPYVVTIHDAIFLRPFRQMADQWSPRQFLSYAYYRWGVKPGAQRARLVLTDSEFSRQELVSQLHLLPEKVHVAHLAVPHLQPPLPETECQQIWKDYSLIQPYLLALGAMDKRKNTANLVRAFARMPRSAATTLVLAGFEKAGYSFVPKLIKQLGITNRVLILDYVPERELTALFQGAAVFVYPTLAEGFGLPILQAFSLGIPVITSRVGAIPEVAGEAVRYVDPMDPPNITKEILSILIDSNEAHRLALAGYLQAKHFSWTETAKRTLAVYSQASMKS